MDLPRYVEAFTALGDETRLRLCALLAERELCVTDLVQVTGISQPRVSTHLGRLREAGLVRDRRQGAQSFYALAADSLPAAARAVLEEAARSHDPTLRGDRARVASLEAERRGDPSESLADELERYYSPGRTWRSLAVGVAGLLRLGDVLDVGAGDGAPAGAIAPYCRTLTCIDKSPRLVDVARARLARHPHARVEVADVHQLPFPAASFDAVLVFHTLTYAEEPGRALAECARVLRPGGRLVLLCLDRHEELEVTARYGERHPGFSPRALRGLLGRAGLDVLCAQPTCRDAKRPHLQVVLAIAEKAPRAASRAVGRAHRKAASKKSKKSKTSKTETPEDTD